MAGGPAAYPEGVAFRWLEGDLVAAAAGHPGRLLRRPPAPRVGAMWATRDPLASALLATRAVTSRLGRLAGGG